jgi:hypothetical protein
VTRSAPANDGCGISTPNALGERHSEQRIASVLEFARNVKMFCTPGPGDIHVCNAEGADGKTSCVGCRRSSNHWRDENSQELDLPQVKADCFVTPTANISTTQWLGCFIKFQHAFINFNYRDLFLSLFLVQQQQQQQQQQRSPLPSLPPQCDVRCRSMHAKKSYKPLKWYRASS